MAKLRGSNAALVHAQAERESQFERAHNLFYATPSTTLLRDAAPPTPANPSAPDSSMATDQGAVQFHLIGQKPSDPRYSDIMQENADNLLGMGGLIYSYMKKQYPSINKKSIDISTWSDVVSHLPDLTIGSSVTKIYNNRVAGVSVSGEFLSLIAKAIITDGASLLTDFTSYLNTIGNVTLSASNSSQSYDVFACTYLSYLVADQVGGYYDYAAIVLRQINFSEHFQELKSSCSSANYVNISMTYQERTALVQSRRIRSGGPDHDMFQKLINSDQTQQFTTAGNFFNGGNTPASDVKPTV